ncbi:MAG: hypothetical protein PHY48_04000 [Candidatus Cloacimonetes bacterium]|nr:hypothetical protein [Candidatus Cloacimonadota bacterium]
MKRLLAITFLITVLSMLIAVDTEYRIGAYSQYQLGNAIQTREVFTDLAQSMSNAGYNTVLYSMGNQDIANDRLEKALAALSKHDLASVIDDWAWLGNGPVGVTAMAYSNYMKMEAEFRLSKQGDKFSPDILDANDRSSDKYNYVFRHDIGRRSKPDPERWSNSYAWICDEEADDQPGIALSEPRFRWKPDSRENSRAIGADLKFYVYTNENKLYLRVAMQWSGVPTGNKVVDISMQALAASAMDSKSKEYGIYPASAYVDLGLRSVNPNLYGTSIHNIPYTELPRDKDSGALVFEYYIDIPQAGTDLYKNVMAEEHFLHISPTIYWHGKGRLEIDYIELEDEPHKALVTAGHPLRKRLQDRLDKIAAVPNAASILFFYGKDEPYQGQFAGYDKLEDFLERMDKRLLTATHLENSNLRKPNGLPDYFHFGLFLHEAKPSVVMLDAYALQEWGVGNSTLIRWNYDVQHELFVQNKLQNTVLNNYRTLATSVRRDQEMKDTKMYFVPQTFGEKYEPVETGEWRYFMPPRSMQKCLQLLPLCYSADGMVDFAITSDPGQPFPSGSRKYRRATPLAHDANYLNLRVPEGSTAYQQLAEANAKIKVYGPIISSLNWVDADSIMVKGVHPNIPLNDLRLKSLQVVPDDKSPYEGFVQCGYYMDGSGNPVFMLVNRRAVYKNQDSPGIVPWDVDKYFSDAAPQTVRFTLADKFDPKTEYTLYDSYAKQLFKFNEGVADVPIAGGDGILLQFVNVLSDKVKKDISVQNDVIVQGNVTVNKKKKLDFTPESQVTFAQNSVITLKKNAIMSIPPNAVFAPDVKFILHPNAQLLWDKTAYPEFPASIERIPVKRCWFKRLFGIK